MKKICFTLTLVLLLIIGCERVPTQVEEMGSLSLEIIYPPDKVTLDINLIKLTGVVSDITANVTIIYTGKPNIVEVAKDGSFYYWVDLAQGPSAIEVIAVKGKEKLVNALTIIFNPPLAVYLDYGLNAVAVSRLEGDEVESSLEITSESRVTLIGSRLAPPSYDLSPHSISVKAGETKSTFFSLRVDKDIQPPKELSYSISRVFSNYSESKTLMPEGLKVLPTSSQFTIWPKVSYYPEIMIETTNKLMPFEYWFFVEYRLDGRVWEKEWFSINVTR